ncbi:MAG: hypothetical protein QG670_1239 [Thermoproteota archaeon]|nr:hypothetical protein [Thermoproteota archaeon]
MRRKRNHRPIQELDFVKEHTSLSEVLQNKALSKLGDSYVNFVYSLAKSIKDKELINERVPSRILAEALKRANLRKYLPNRISRHDQGDAAEALIGYGWSQGLVSLEECVHILAQRGDDPIEAFVSLIKSTMGRLEVTDWQRK